MGVIDIEYASPFVTATLDALEAVAMARPRCGVPAAAAGEVCPEAIRGLVPFAGETSGHVAVTFPDRLARRVYSCMVGEDPGEQAAAVRDAVGEVVNLIAGGAKARLARRGQSFRIGLPRVAVGRCPDAGGDPFSSLVVPFSLYGETFWLELSVVRSGPVAA